MPLKIFEAWAEVGFTDKLSLTVGRQALAYDYNRIFATSNWTVDGQSHDLALLRLNDADLGLKADLGLAINNPSDALSEPVTTTTLSSIAIWSSCAWSRASPIC